MKYYETDYIDETERKKLEQKGLFCYDIRSGDNGEIAATIEKRVMVNNVGHIITNEEIEFKNDFIIYDNFIESNNNVSSIDKLLKTKKDRER